MRQFRVWAGTLAFAAFSFVWAFLLQVWSVIVGKEPANFDWSPDLVSSVFPFGIGVIYMAPVVVLSLRQKKHFVLRIGIFILVSIVVKVVGSSTFYVPGLVAFAVISSLFAVAVKYLSTNKDLWWYLTAYWVAVSGGFWIAVSSGNIIARFDSALHWLLLVLIQVAIMVLLACIAVKVDGRVPTKSIVKLLAFAIICLLLPYVFLIPGVPAARF